MGCQNQLCSNYWPAKIKFLLFCHFLVSKNQFINIVLDWRQKIAIPKQCSGIVVYWHDWSSYLTHPVIKYVTVSLWFCHHMKKVITKIRMPFFHFLIREWEIIKICFIFCYTPIILPATTNDIVFFYCCNNILIEMNLFESMRLVKCNLAAEMLAVFIPWWMRSL